MSGVFFDNIPQYIRMIPHWVLWRFEGEQGVKPRKIPYTPFNGQKARSNDAATWGTFEQAKYEFLKGAFSGIGYMQSADDGLSIIDLDIAEGDTPNAIQLEIYKQTTGYAEYSPSGRGLHIIVGGKPERAVHNAENGIEVYPHGRYMTFTGNAIRQGNLTETSGLLSYIVDTYSNNRFIDAPADRQPILSDQDVLNKCWHALNGAYFQQLWNMSPAQVLAESGNHSDLEQGLVNLLHEVSRNRAQVERLWLQSHLAQRPKTQTRPDYRAYTLDKACDLDAKRDHEQAIFEHARQEIKAIQSAPSNPAHEPIQPASIEGQYQIPGLLGEIVQAGMASLVKPVYEVALAAGLGVMSGICGRAYTTPTNAGLNQYLLVLGDTGIGKDGVSRIVSTLLGAASSIAFQDFGTFLGSANFASKQGLRNYLNDNPCFVSCFGEMGLRLQQMCSQRASPHQAELMGFMLDIFGKSELGGVEGGSSYSDKDKSSGKIKSPSFSFVGDATPSSFFPAVTSENIASGLYPRITLLNYNGKRPYSNQSAKSLYEQKDVIEGVKDLCIQSLKLQQGDMRLKVEFDDESKRYCLTLDRSIDDKINSMPRDRDYERELLSRMYLKILKLASIIAIGCNYHNPIIDVSYVKIAEQIEYASYKVYVDRIESGQVGETMNCSISDKMKRLILSCKKFLDDSPKLKCKGKDKMIELSCVPVQFFNIDHVDAHRSFVNAKPSAKFARNETLKEMEAAGMISKPFRFGTLALLSGTEHQTIYAEVIQLLPAFFEKGNI